MLEDSLSKMHLHWFAAEDEGRTEPPTDQKIRKAQEEGRFAKSTDLTSSITMLFGIVTLGFLGPYMTETLKEMMTFFFSRNLIEGQGALLWRRILSYFLNLTLPIMAVVVVGAVLASMLQTRGFRFSIKPIQPNFQKIAPDLPKWLKRSFGWPEGVFSLGKTVGKVGVVLLSVALLVYQDYFHLILLMRSSDPRSVLSFVGFLIFKVLLLATLVFIVISILDYIFQRKQYLDSLKMTKHEVKDEQRQTDGDPMLRARIRRRMRELLQVNLGKTIPQADVVVTNPTHFAVALQWDRYSMEAPMLSAKGADEVAFRIRRIAQDHDVPIMENKPLARGLYDNVEVGEIIPERYWELVSRILAEVYKIKGKAL